MTNRLIIIGAGGHGKVAAECAESMSVFDEIVFLDAKAEELNIIGPWKVIGVPEHFSKYVTHNTEFFVAIGDNYTREVWVNKLLGANMSLATLIHASATVSDYSTVAIGSLVCAHAVVNPFSSMGLATILNTGATLDHDCMVSDFVHIAPGCHIAGIVNIGEFCFIGIGCNVVQSVNIGKHCVLGAGSVVVSNIKENSLGYGVPAKIIKTIEQ